MITKRAHDLTLQLAENKNVKIIINGVEYPFEIEIISLEHSTKSPTITGFVALRDDEDFNPDELEEA